MTAIANLFWDEDARRLRLLWRLALHTILLIVLALVFVTLASIPATLVGFAIFGQDVMLERLGDQAVLSGDPLFLAASAVGVLPAVLLATWLAGRFIDQRRVTAFGLKLDGGWFLDLGFGLALGAVLMALIFLVELAFGWIEVTGTFVGREYPFGWAFAGQLVVFFCVGIYEEVVSRGYHFKNMSEGFTGVGRIPGIVLAFVLSSAVFGVAHALNPNASVLSTFNIMLAGFLLGLGMLLTGSLAIPIGLHMTWNFFQGAVFGFPVSGMSSAGSVFAIEQGGPRLLTGGPFGPEAGLIGIAAMVLGIGLTVLYVRLRYGSIGIHTELADHEDRRAA